MTRWLLFLSLFLTGGIASLALADDAPVTLIQLNDWYDIFPVRVTQNRASILKGGAAYVATRVRQQRILGSTLLLHAGDMFFPSLLSGRLKHRGSQMVEALNLLAVDLATFGNHEFDEGCQVFAERIRQSRFPWVSANVDIPTTANIPAGQVTATRVLTAGGMRLGFFGLTVEIPPVAGCQGESIQFRPPLPAAQAAVAELRALGVDRVIALTHLRLDEDQALARQIPDIDVIVGGHDHEVIRVQEGRTLISKAGEDAVGLAFIRLLPECHDWRWEPVDPAVLTPAPDLLEWLAPYARELEPYQRVAGETRVALDAQESTVRRAESNLGNWIVDALRTTMRADVGIFNGGGIRDDRVILPGVITLGDLYRLLPYANRMVARTVSGEQIRAALENGVSHVELKSGRFPQVSGLSFRYDPERPRGQRLLETKIGGQALDLAGHYRLATTEYLAKNGRNDGYVTIFAGEPGEWQSGGDLNEALLALLSQGPIAPALEGRIQAVTSSAR
ncbi:MAG: 5'-nucleotidase C-terminal domain-containing protein [Pseudomonadota bacterium]